MEELNSFFFHTSKNLLIIIPSDNFCGFANKKAWKHVDPNLFSNAGAEGGYGKISLDLNTG